MIRYYGGLMMGLLMDESARRSYDADREDLRGRLPSADRSKKADGHRFLWAKLFAGIQTPFRALRTRSQWYGRRQRAFRTTTYPAANRRHDGTVGLPSYNLGRR